MGGFDGRSISIGAMKEAWCNELIDGFETVGAAPTRLPGGMWEFQSGKLAPTRQEILKS